jgi:glycosyltransferase involved in cell wall biosynthesis
MPALLAGVDALLSAAQPHAGETLDKVVYEAAACAVPVLASNVALDEFLADLPLELRFPARDADRLAQLLLDLAAAPPDERAATGAELRSRVVVGHSVDSWADAVAAAVLDLRRE